MKNFSKYILIASDENEFDKFNNLHMKDAFDVTFYLNILNTQSSKMLLGIIENNIDFLDSKNACIDFEVIKKKLAINRNFVVLIDPEKPLDENNVKIDINSLKLTKTQASEICKEIHNNIFDTILKLKDKKLLL